MEFDKVVPHTDGGYDRIIFKNSYGFKLIVPATKDLFTTRGIKALEEVQLHIAEMTALCN